MWLDRWVAISARITGLVDAGNLMALTLAGTRTDDFGVGKKWIVPELEALKAELEQFATEYCVALPVDAGAALKRFLERVGTGSAIEGSSNIQAIVPFGIFRSEFEYLIRDRELEARTLTELAFEHLARLLAVDGDTRTKWLEAFDSHEMRCEQLGAVHLLSHGIWAFKVSSAGSATDLVYGEPIETQVTAIRRTTRALVLTEWKLVRNSAELDAQATNARKQGELYSEGVLHEIVLKSTRYIVLVSKKRLQPPDDLCENGVTYRHIVVPVDPDPSSVAARKAKTPLNTTLQQPGARGVRPGC
jgi:hypothetical protein